MRALRIIIALKKFFAARAVESMGAIVHDAIQRFFIPRLQKRLKTARTTEEQNKIQELIDLYEQYSDPLNSLSKIYSETAAKNIQNLVRAYHLGPDTADDIAQDVAGDFYRSPGSRMDFLQREFKEMDGPEALNKLWSSIVSGQAKYRMRDLYTHSPSLSQSMREDGEEDQLSSIPAPEPDKYTKEEWEQFVSLLEDGMKTELTDPIDKKIWEIWYKIILPGGRAKAFKDMWPMIRDRVDISHSGFDYKWGKIQNLMIKVMERGGQRVPQRYKDMVKKKMHISSVDILTHEFYRRRLAAWILGSWI